MGYLAYGRLNKMEVELQKQFSNYNKSKLVFHKRFVLIVFLFCVIWFVAITYCQIYNITSLSLYFSIWLFMAFVIHWIAWTGFINDDALLPDFENNFTFDVIKTEEKYQSKEKIFFDANNEYYRSLVLLFEEERFF